MAFNRTRCLLRVPHVCSVPSCRRSEYRTDRLLRHCVGVRATPCSGRPRFPVQLPACVYPALASAASATRWSCLICSYIPVLVSRLLTLLAYRAGMFSFSNVAPQSLIQDSPLTGPFMYCIDTLDSARLFGYIEALQPWNATGESTANCRGSRNSCNPGMFRWAFPLVLLPINFGLPADACKHRPVGARLRLVPCSSSTSSRSPYGSVQKDGRSSTATRRPVP